MFNEKQKIEFINTLPDANDKILKRNMVNFFERLGRKVESKLNKDLCEMDYSEAKLAVTLVSGRTLDSVKWSLSRLKQYYDWCINNGRTSRLENPLDIISPDEIDNSNVYTMEMIKDPNHLQYVLDVVFPDVSEETGHNASRLYIWLLYNGLTEQEASYIKKTDVDLSNKTIRLSNRTIEMYEQTFELADWFMHATHFNVLCSDMRNMRRKIRQNEFLLNTHKERSIDPAYQFSQQITRLNMLYKKYTNENIKLTPKRIYESGIFYRWLPLAQIPIEEYVEEVMRGNEYADHEATKQQKIRQTVHAFNMWKKAFYGG